MKPIEQARLDLNALEASPAHTELLKRADMIVDAAMKLKKVMAEKGIQAAVAKCPQCEGEKSLHGRLIVGQAAGRHRRSGGAFRMWCDTCPDIKMME